MSEIPFKKNGRLWCTKGVWVDASDQCYISVDKDMYWKDVVTFRCASCNEVHKSHIKED